MKKNSISAKSTPIDGMTCRLLLVDDERPVLDALKRCLRKEAFQIDAFSDPLMALEQARKVSYDLVLSDYRMPELDGVMLLAFIRQIQPHAVRMILSAYTDKQAMLEAINQAQIHRFMQKPWDDDQLRFALNQAIHLT